MLSIVSFVSYIFPNKGQRGLGTFDKLYPGRVITPWFVMKSLSCSGLVAGHIQCGQCCILYVLSIHCCCFLKSALQEWCNSRKVFLKVPCWLKCKNWFLYRWRLMLPGSVWQRLVQCQMVESVFTRFRQCVSASHLVLLCAFTNLLQSMSRIPWIILVGFLYSLSVQIWILSH